MAQQAVRYERYLHKGAGKWKGTVYKVQNPSNPESRVSPEYDGLLRLIPTTSRAEMMPGVSRPKFMHVEAVRADKDQAAAIAEGPEARKPTDFQAGGTGRWTCRGTSCRRRAEGSTVIPSVPTNKSPNEEEMRAGNRRLNVLSNRARRQFNARPAMDSGNFEGLGWFGRNKRKRAAIAAAQAAAQAAVQQAAAQAAQNVLVSPQMQQIIAKQGRPTFIGFGADEPYTWEWSAKNVAILAAVLYGLHRFVLKKRG